MAKLIDFLKITFERSCCLSNVKNLLTESSDMSNSTHSNRILYTSKSQSMKGSIFMFLLLESVTLTNRLLQLTSLLLIPLSIIFVTSFICKRYIEKNSKTRKDFL